ncbi:MAG: nucleotidyltransferase family protein, partial [Bacteroidota bacterium]
MKSMLFAAGLGTRLRPLTNDRPKAMVQVKGKPLLQWAIEKLIASGCEEMIINVHHYAEMIIDFLRVKNNFGIDIEISDETEKILETGGGLKKAQHFFRGDAPFIICNVDILSNIDLIKFYEHHLATNALATLAIRNRSTSRYLLFDPKNRLVGWKNEKSGEIKSHLRHDQINDPSIKKLAFSGMHVLSPQIFEFMSNEDKFSIIDVYLRAMKNNLIAGYPHDQDFWLDVGKPESLKIAEQSD